MSDFFEDFIVDFHDLVPDPETLLLCQAPGLHLGHVDADPMLRAAADAEAQALVALVPLHGNLPQLARRLVDEVPPEQRHQGSCPVAAGAESVRRVPQSHLELGRVVRRIMPRGCRVGAGEVARRGVGVAIACN